MDRQLWMAVIDLLSEIPDLNVAAAEPFADLDRIIHLHWSGRSEYFVLTGQECRLVVELVAFIPGQGWRSWKQLYVDLGDPDCWEKVVEFLEVGRSR